ncbi:hypothetical protein KAI32_02930 [Candidatus Pacearchaeota archaeon]|nr:hypothetical protein [Candidatus Pacearchaeota archaeon]
MKNKRGGLLQQTIVHIVLVGLIFALFLFATADKINSRGVRQQVLEKQVALLIDSAVPGMSFVIEKNNLNGLVQRVEVRDGKVFVMVEGLSSFKGYPYFSKYSVSVREEDNKFVVSINE